MSEHVAPGPLLFSIINILEEESGFFSSMLHNNEFPTTILMLTIRLLAIYTGLIYCTLGCLSFGAFLTHHSSLEILWNSSSNSLTIYRLRSILIDH